MATAILASMLLQHGHESLVEVSSAGIWASEGQPATAPAQKVMDERGLDVSDHKAHHLVPEDVDAADLIVTMERSIAEAITIEAPEHAAKVVTLRELADDPGDVEDPIGGSLAEYRHAAVTLQSLLHRAYRRILCRLGIPI